MFKLIRRIICLAILLLGLFVWLALWHGGGEKFRWFGQKVQRKSEDVAKKADRLQEEAQDVKDLVDKGVKGIKNATETLKDIGEKTGARVEEKVEEDKQVVERKNIGEAEKPSAEESGKEIPGKDD